MPGAAFWKMANCVHDQAETSSAAPWCYLAVMCLAVLLPHLTAFVAGSAAVSPAAVHPLLTSPPPTRTPKCDRMYISNRDGNKNGTFSAPWLENPNEYYHQCIYTFIAAENERVQVSFANFNLRGSPPECNHEYMDLYTEIANLSAELITTPFGGRYCGRIGPRRRISMHRTLVIGFYTDEIHVDGDIFQGNYEFIDAGQYEVGTPAPNSVCTFTIYSDRKREGEVLSPTYPGVYPKNLQCHYRFMGRKGQRVRLEFMDFDLYYGGPHPSCPFDVMKVYDGSSDEAPLIGPYCGQKRNLVVYSSAENLYVHFATLQRTADTQNRGFAGYFEFSERFVNLGFIGKNDGEHIRGTECDQKILSKKESNGTVYSPNYPFLYQGNTVCKYYIYGMQDAQHLERVRLEFEKFEIQSADQECSDGYLKLYLQGQEGRGALDEFDHIFCGQNLPPTIESDSPRLMMVFSSSSVQGQGFKARYSFQTDYKIPGTPSPDGSCDFTYFSESVKTGEFNSPRHPSNYPLNIRCEYLFKGLPGEQVKIVFNYFRTKTEVEKGYNDACTEDWLEIYEVRSDNETKLGRYCSKTAPGPILSDIGVHTLKAIFYSNEEGVSSGFSATYSFIPAINIIGDCGLNITGKKTGVVTTPGFPANYEATSQICNWYINVKPNHKVLLLFEFFLVEGNPEGRGCPGAVVRLWKDSVQTPVELCGESLTNDTQQIVSTSNILKFSFITAEKAVGSEGFKAVWTEVKDGPKCEEFHCKKHGFCIANSMRCNSMSNCGFLDSSDETNCRYDTGLNIYLVGGLSLGGAVLATLILCIVCHRKRRRRRRNHQVPPPFESRQKLPREVPGMHFISVDTV